MSSEKKTRPPKLAKRIFRWYCSEALIEEIEGDLEERFHDHLQQYSGAKARRLYWLNVFKFFSWHTIKRRKSSTTHASQSTMMLKNYFKIAIRNAKRHKVYTGINLLGLTLGLTSSILILLYVNHQLSYDQFHEKKDNLYRISIGPWAITPNIVGPTLKRTFSEDIQSSVRMAFFNKQVFNYQEEGFTSKMAYADLDFFKLFSFQFLTGNHYTALANPNSLVVTKKAALKHFGTTDILNATVQVSGQNYTVTGVIEDIPSNSTIQFSFLGSLEGTRWVEKEQWSNAMYHTFLLLSKDLDPSLESKVKKHVYQLLEIGSDAGDAPNINWINIQDLHLRSDLSYEIGNTSSMTGVYIFSSIALLILLMACVNYVNLATSRSLERAKEVGMRKVMGAQRNQFYYQFLGESVIYVFSSLIFAFTILYYLLPDFNQLAGVTIDTAYLWSAEFWMGMLVLGLIMSFLSGFYPAVIMSTFKPLSILKGSQGQKGNRNLMKKALIVFQFSISAFLLVSTMVIGKQLSFIQGRDLGYNTEHVLYFAMNDGLRNNMEAFNHQLRSNPQIRAISLSSSTPLNVGAKGGTKRLEYSDDKYFTTAFLKADEHFIDLMEIRLVAGRSFLPNDGSWKDSQEGKLPVVVINETMAKMLDWTPDEAVNKRINYGKGEVLIVGVAADFHSSSLKNLIEPFMILYNKRDPYYAMIKIGPDEIGQTLSFIEEQTQSSAPGLLFDYRFLDDQFDRMYSLESRLNKIFSIFSTIAIIIATLGILGLISHMALNRAKEISIRKVLGASVQNILTLISSDFLKLIAIALIIALPSSYFFMNNWLADYAYRTSIGIDILIYAIVLSVAITILAISYQTLKTALVNPANILRSE